MRAPRLLPFLPLCVLAFGAAGPVAGEPCPDDEHADDGDLSANLDISICQPPSQRSRATVTVTGGGLVGESTNPSTLPPSGDPAFIDGAGTNVVTSTAPFEVPITPGQEYTVAWSHEAGSNNTQSIHTLVTRKDLPDGYRIQVNEGDGHGWKTANQMDEASPGEPLNLPDVVQQFRVLRPVRPAGPVGAPMLTRSTGDVHIPAARHLVSLGAAVESGRIITAGDLVIHKILWFEPEPGVSFEVTPDCLSYEGADTAGTGVEVLTDANGWVRQILAPDLFLDVVVTTAGEQFEVRFYDPAAVAGQSPAPVYAPTGAAHRVITVMETGASGNFPFGVRLETREDGAVVGSIEMAARQVDADTFDSRRVEGDEVELILNNCFEYPANHSETIGDEYIYLGSGGFVQNRGRLETITLTRDGITVAKTVNRYLEITGWNDGTNFYLGTGWGEGLIEKKEFHGPGAGDYRLTQYWRDWFPEYDGQYPPPPKFRGPELTIRPDGSWLREERDGYGRTVRIYRPHLGAPASAWDANASNCDYETQSWTADPDDPVLPGVAGYTETISRLPGQTQRWINGIPAGRADHEYASTSRHGEPALRTTRREYFSATGFATTVSTSYRQTASTHLRGRMISEQPPGDRLESYDYERGTFDPVARSFTPDPAGTDLRETRTEGTVTNPDGLVTAGKSRTMRHRFVRDAVGRVHQDRTEIFTGGTAYDAATVTDYEYDALGRLTAELRDGRVIREVASNGLQRTETSANGTVTVITRDLNGRIVSEAKQGGPATTTAYDGLATTVSFGSLSRSEQRDLAGRVTSETDFQGRTTQRAYPNGGRDLETTSPGGLKVRRTNHPGGPLVSITNTGGSRIIPRYYEYGVNADGSQWTRERLATAGSPRWRLDTRDWLGRLVRTEGPAPDGGGTVVTTIAYGPAGSRTSETFSANTGLAPRLYEYDALGRVIRTGLDRGATAGVLDPASRDEITESDYFYEKTGGQWYEVRAMREFHHDDDGTATELGDVRVRLSGDAGGTASQVLTTDASGVTTEVTEVVDRAQQTVTVTTARSDRGLTGLQVITNGLLVSERTSIDTAAATYEYDALERPWKSTNARSGAVTTRAYNAEGLLESVTDHLGNETTWFYHPATHRNAGAVREIRDANLQSTYFEYDDRGAETRVWGAAVNPRAQAYDVYGQMATLTTYRGGTGWDAATWPAGTTGAGDTTTWTYAAATGLLVDKADALGRRTRYQWHDNGQIATREWERDGLTTTYAYDDAGRESSRTYSDGTTPAVAYLRNRDGTIAEVTDAAGTRTITYAPGGSPELISVAGTGLLAGHDVDYGRDAFGRTTSVAVRQGANPLYDTTIGYDPVTGRLASVRSGDHAVRYHYHPNSNLVRQLTLQRDGAPVLARATGYDVLDRIASVQSMAVGPTGVLAPVAFHGYRHDALGRRDRIDLLDGSHWALTYTARGEVASCDKVLAGGASLAAGQQFAFAYDHAGNRTAKMSGGDATGAGRRTTTSTSNALNQFATRQVPPTFDVIGRSDAPVSVNGAAATMQGDHFRAELTAANDPDGDWFHVTVTAGGDSEDGHRSIPPADVTPIYDEDGNLLADGAWTYGYDAENRLISAERSASALAAGAPWRQIEYAYDYLHRRIQRTVFHAPAGPAVETEKYLHSGHNRILTLDAASQPVQSCVWGLDLSGTPQGAGGVGGLLWITDHRDGRTRFICHDANGNVVNLVTADTAEVTATYEYNPYGEALRTSGPDADLNSFRFSTKPRDPDTGLLDFGYRSLKPSWGTWLGRDPLEEAGGINLYAMVGNDPVNAIDYLGLCSSELPCDAERSALEECQRELVESNQRIEFLEQQAQVILNLERIAENDLADSLEHIRDTNSGHASDFVNITAGTVGTAIGAIAVRSATTGAARGLGIASVGFGVVSFGTGVAGFYADIISNESASISGSRAVDRLRGYRQQVDIAKNRLQSAQLIAQHKQAECARKREELRRCQQGAGDQCPCDK